MISVINNVTHLSYNCIKNDIQDTYVTSKQVQNAAPLGGYVFEVSELRNSPFITYSHSYLGNGNEASQMEAVQAMPTSKGIHPCFSNGNGTIPLIYTYNGMSGEAHLLTCISRRYLSILCMHDYCMQAIYSCMHAMSLEVALYMPGLVSDVNIKHYVFKSILNIITMPASPY